MSYAQFVTNDEIITLTAKFSNGTEAPTYWKKAAHVEFERWRHAEQSEDLSRIERGKQLFIAATLVNEDGTRAFTDKDSIKLTAEGVSVLWPLALQAAGILRPKDVSPGNASGEEASST